MYVNQIKQKIKNDIFSMLVKCISKQFKSRERQLILLLRNFQLSILMPLLARCIQKNVVCNKMPVFRHQ